MHERQPHARHMACKRDRPKALPKQKSSKPGEAAHTARMVTGSAALKRAAHCERDMPPSLSSKTDPQIIMEYQHCGNILDGEECDRPEQGWALGGISPAVQHDTELILSTSHLPLWCILTGASTIGHSPGTSPLAKGPSA